MDSNKYNVLIIFFNNFERFKESFDSIRKVKPGTLFLYQDGPRDGKDDLNGIMLCRNYAEKNIDWDCKVHKFYQDTNYGCDPSNFIAQKWAFSIVDKCIVLEDDDVCPMSFFAFCWELLERYENDNRISIICGMNNLDTYNAENGWDYFFTSSGSIWGWASWRRVIDTWDEKYSWLDDTNKIEAMKRFFVSKKSFNKFIQLAKERRKLGVPFYETILGASQMLNNQLNIVPTKNLVCNIGNKNGVHTSNDTRLIPKKMQGLYFKKTFELTYPLTGPDYFYDDLKYKRRIYKMNTLNLFEKIALKLRKLLFH